MKGGILLTALFTAGCLTVSAQNSTMEAVRDIVEDGYNFWIYTPESYYEPQMVTTEVAVNDTINIAINDPSICNGNSRTSQIVVTIGYARYGRCRQVSQRYEDTV